ncbi:hypothetical protein J2X41_002444 [Caulobacter sp. BE254]|nr:hypothetical protein [Caulobacter sp. BE254]
MFAFWLGAALAIGASASASGGPAVVPLAAAPAAIECPAGETPFAIAPSTPDGLVLTFAGGEKRVLHRPVAVCTHTDRPDDPVLVEALMAASVPAESPPVKAKLP